MSMEVRPPPRSPLRTDGLLLDGRRRAPGLIILSCPVSTVKLQDGSLPITDESRPAPQLSATTRYPFCTESGMYCGELAARAGGVARPTA